MKRPLMEAERHIKKLVKPVIRSAFRWLPLGVLEKGIRVRPSLVDYLPPNRQMIFKKYLGDVCVHIDTLYAIERQMITGSYDRETIEIINKVLNRGDVCVDVGANVGPLSFALAKRVMPEGRVYSCEPGPFLFRRLLSNLKLNPGYERIVLAFAVGFSDKKESRLWNEDKINRGNAGFLFQEPNQQERIELTTLDRFVTEQDVQRVDFIKIDVEGMEYEVLKGGIGTIERHKPILYYETGLTEKGFWAEHLRAQRVILAIEQLLEGLGYKFYKMESGAFKETHYPDLGYNTLAVWGGI